MYRPAVVFGLYLSFAIAVGAACSNGSPAVPSDDDGSFTPPGQGGNAGTGSMMTGTGGSFMPTGGAGGSVSSGGTTGGTVSSGGTTGGTVSSGGKAGGGTTTGGSTGSGGRSTGGTGGTGGSTGGSTATGGSSSGSAGTGTGTGGTMTGGAGTTGAACDATWMVSADGFVRMPTKGGGCWSGYAFGGGDKSSTVTFPGGAMDFSKSQGKLELSGTVGSATADNMYAGNVYFGFNIGQPQGMTTSAKVTPTGTGLTITCTGCSMPMMRAQIGDGTTTWCANLTSGTAIPYTSFAQECYNTPAGAAYAKQPINSIQISIPGTAMAATFDLTLMTVVEN
jgi:hypothetical protein